MSGAVEGLALLPCPFCGAAEDALSNAGELYSYRVVCEVCDAEGPSTEFSPKVPGSFAAASGEAHAAWNTRTTPPARSYADGVEDAARIVSQKAQAISTKLGRGKVLDEVTLGIIAILTDAAADIRLLSQGEKA